MRLSVVFAILHESVQISTKFMPMRFLERAMWNSPEESCVTNGLVLRDTSHCKFDSVKKVYIPLLEPFEPSHGVRWLTESDSLTPQILTVSVNMDLNAERVDKVISSIIVVNNSDP